LRYDNKTAFIGSRKRIDAYDQHIRRAARYRQVESYSLVPVYHDRSGRITGDRRRDGYQGTRSGPVYQAPEEATVTNTQSSTLWEICRQGLPLLADEAAERWDQGQPFELQPRFHVAPTLEAMIKQCNWEITQPKESEQA
jgi:hypothetical protein